MIKKQILTLSLIVLSTGTNIQAFIPKKAHTVLLESPIIRFIDGHAYGIDGEGIKDLMRIIREIANVHLGRLRKNRKRVGQFTWQGEKHSLKTLAAAEREYIAQGTYAQHKAGLTKLLEDIKKTFEEIVAPFMENARGAKGQMLVLIEESCTKRDLKGTFLLDWGAAKEGEDLELFRSNIDTLDKLDRFCTDLTNFLEDLMHSCRKGMGQFIHGAKTKIVRKHLNAILKNKAGKDNLIKQFVAHLNKDKMESLTWKQANNEQHIKKLLDEFKAS